jgi:HD superfamily phosphohydrolase
MVIFTWGNQMTTLPNPLALDITVQDPVHGRIPLTAVERSVINTPQFQRLRRIGQLGPADFVFPGASHSRLAHSLGSAHVMGLMLTQPALQEHFSGREHMIQILRLAALLHDLGHLPFSHIGEIAYGIVDQGGIERYASGELTAFDVAASGSGHGLHEELTVALIREGQVGARIDSHLQSVDGENASEVIAKIIEGSYSSDLVCTNLVSSDLDCDRLDYLVRDSMAAGLTYGRVDLAYLIESLVVASHPKFGQMLAVDEKSGTSAVEHYLLARYYYYARFVGHKTIAAAEILMIVALLELVRIGKLPENSAALKGSVAGSEFVHFNDSLAWHYFHLATEESGEPVLQEATKCLVDRTLLKCAYLQEDLEEIPKSDSHEENKLDSRFQDSKSKQRLADDAGVDVESFCFLRRRRTLTGMPGSITPTQIVEDDDNTVAGQWVKSAKVANAGDKPRLLAERGEMLRHISTREWVTRSVLVREPNGSAEDKDNRPTTNALCQYLRKEIG